MAAKFKGRAKQYVDYRSKNGQIVKVVAKKTTVIKSGVRAPKYS